MTNHNKILVVEDEKHISDVIKAYLEKEEYEVLTSFDGENALEKFNNNNIDLIILDLMIPKISGEQVCSKIRNNSNVPIIILTAKDDEDSTVECLTMGADDYMVKPFSPRELVTRVKAIIRRSYRLEIPSSKKLIFNNELEILVDEFIVNKNGKKTDLTSNEFKVLLALASNPNIVFTREQLIKSAFGLDYEGFDRTIDTHIKNIRQKIENDPKKPEYISTVYGVGYKFQKEKVI